MSAAQEAVEDRRWLASQGFSPATLPKRATWYRYDGLPLHNLPTDPYHRRRYRERGCTLKPPSGTGVQNVLPPKEYSRAEVAQILIESMQEAANVAGH